MSINHKPQREPEHNNISQTPGWFNHKSTKKQWLMLLLLRDLFFFSSALAACLSQITLWQPLVQRSHSWSCADPSPCSTRWWVPVFSWPRLWYGSSWTRSFLEERCRNGCKRRNYDINSRIFFLLILPMYGLYNASLYGQSDAYRHGIKAVSVSDQSAFFSEWLCLLRNVMRI